MATDACLEEARNFARENFQLEYSECPLPSEVSLSVLILGQTLGSSRNFIWKDITGLEHSFSVASTFTHRRMLDAGWCPNEVLMLENLLRSRSTLYIASRFDRL